MSETWKIGINAGAYHVQTPEESIDAIARAGFDACFTNWNETTDVAALAARIRSLGLIYQSIHAPFGPCSALWDEGDAGDEFASVLIRCIHDCAENDVPIAVMHPIIGMDRNTPPSALGLKRFERIIKAAEETPVRLAFENVEHINYLQALIDAFADSPAVGFCWDTGHELCYNHAEDVPARYGDKLICTHLNDNLGMTDPSVLTFLDDAHLMPFDGTADWAGICKRLKRAHYQGILMMELCSQAKPGRNTHDRYAALDQDAYLRQALERGRRIAALMDETPDC